MGGLAFVTQALELRRDPLAFYEKLAREEGPVARFRLGPQRLVLVSSADAVGEVLMNDLDGWKKGAGNAPLEPLIGEGLFLAEGDTWHRKRKALRPLFTREHVQGLEPIAREETGRLLERLDVHASAGATFDLHAEIRRTTLAVASRGVVGTDLFAERPELGGALERMWQRASFFMNAGGPWSLDLPLPKNRAFRRDRAEVDAAIAEAVARRAGQPELVDLIGTLRDSAELRDEIMTFLLTGQECASIAVAWAAVALARAPELRRAMVAAAEAEGPHAPLVQRVVRESMRAYPPAWMMAREPRHEAGFSVAGEHVDAKTIVLLCVWNVHRDPAIWPDPDRFDPGRFAPDAPRRPKLSYLPFGLGPRTCIGMTLAGMLAELLVAEIHRRFDVVIDDPPIVPDPGMTLRPRGGVAARVARRA